MNNDMIVNGSKVNKDFYDDYNDWKKANKSKRIKEKDKLYKEYNDRLEKEIDGKNFNFKSQYSKGNGGELKKKFWSKISSSRICFELYSWIANEPGCLDFAFEKKFPAVSSAGRKINSNMDVWIKTSTDIWFIESKFTEEPENISDLPEAYYQTRDENKQIIDPTEYYNETFYRKVKPKRGTNPYAQYSLKKRYFGRELVMKRFVDFIKHFMESELQSDWFDTKQETCHLLGIIMYIIDNQEEIKNSNIQNINFRNIVFNKGGCEAYITEDKLAEHFMSKARVLVNDIIDKYNIKVTFTYEALSIQDVLNKYGDRNAYGYENKTVLQCIIDNFKGIEEFL